MRSAIIAKLLPLASILFLTSSVKAQDFDIVEAIRKGLETGNLDRQKAILILIPEAGLKDKSLTATINILKDYLKKPINDECRVLALTSLGRLTPRAPDVVGVLEDNLKGRSVEVRRAAGTALVAISAGTSAELGRPGNLTVGNPEALSSVTGGAATVVWTRRWTTILLNEQVEFFRYGEGCKNLMPLCSLALKDTDDNLRASGAEAMRGLAAAINDVLPDPASSTTETRTIDPFEAKVKWLLLQPAFKALDTAAPSLITALSSTNAETRLAATRAAEAVTSVRRLALASRRAEPNNLQTLVDMVPPEDPLLDSTNQLAVPLSQRLNDTKPAIRLSAAEALEHLGSSGRSQLAEIIKATTNKDVFVRWVATRNLGRLLPGASLVDSENIVAALRTRVLDSDLDVAAAALTSLGKGGNAARSASDVLLQRAGHGDPDTCILAIRTLDVIAADRAKIAEGLIPILRSESARVRRAAVIYLGRAGSASRVAIPELRKLLTDPDEDVRKETARAILMIERDL